MARRRIAGAARARARLAAGAAHARRRCSCRWSSASAGWTVLLTQRAATLKDHAGQISFPGGRIEPQDADAWQAALREAHEEIGLSESFVEFAGYLPDHWVGTGFRVTPAVGFVNPRYELRIATAEVHDVFEVPLRLHPGRRQSQAAPAAARGCDDRGLRHPVRRAQHLGRDRRACCSRCAACCKARGRAAPMRRPNELRACASCSRSWSGCARPTAARGIGSRPSRASRPTPSRRPTRSPMPSSAAISRISRMSSGDLLFQVVFHAQIARERGRVRFRGGGGGDLRQARAAPSARVRRQRRHGSSAAEQSVAWEDIKARGTRRRRRGERARRRAAGRCPR